MQADVLATEAVRDSDVAGADDAADDDDGDDHTEEGEDEEEVRSGMFIRSVVAVAHACTSAVSVCRRWSVHRASFCSN